jgi:hypothetical protein
VALAALTSFSGCINYYYTPGVYEIEEGRVAPLASVGSVEVISIQESDPDRNYIFFEPGPPNGTPIARKSQKPSPHSCPVRSLARTGTSRHLRRTMKVAIPRISLTPATWVSVADLFVQVSLDDGPLRQFQIKNKSPGNIWRVMNGGIAIAVIGILNDPGARSWMAG